MLNTDFSNFIEIIIFQLFFFFPSDAMTVPTLWIGSSVGSVFYVMANVPVGNEIRSTQPVLLSSVGQNKTHI